MPRRYPSEVRDRAVRMALDTLGEYESVSKGARALAPEPNVGTETLRHRLLGRHRSTGSRSVSRPNTNSIHIKFHFPCGFFVT